MAAAIVVVLCLSWGFNQVATKLAIHDIPPLTQATIRSVVATLLIAGWCRLRGIPLLARDGTLLAGLAAGVLFARRIHPDLSGSASTPPRRARCCSSISRRSSSCSARASFLPVDRFRRGAMAGPRVVLCRHDGGVRPADAGDRSAPDYSAT